MVFGLLNHRRHTEWNIVVIVLVLLLQEMNASSSKKQLLEEDSPPAGNLMEHAHREEEKIIDDNLVGNNRNDQMQKGLKGHGQLEGRQQNRLDRSPKSAREVKVIDADLNNESVDDDSSETGTIYLPRIARNVGFWQQEPLMARHEFLRSRPKVEFVEPLPFRLPRRNVGLERFYGMYNNPSRFYNMNVQRRSARNRVNPGHGYRNSRYSIDDNLNPGETFHVGQNINSVVRKRQGPVRYNPHTRSLVPVARKQRKPTTYRLVPIINTAKGKTIKTNKRQQSSQETCKSSQSQSTTAKPCPLKDAATPCTPPQEASSACQSSAEEGEPLEELTTQCPKANETVCDKPDKGAPQYQVMAKPHKKIHGNETKGENGTMENDEIAKKDMLKQIISTLEEFKPHTSMNGTETKDNTPCSILGSWISEAGGVRFDITRSTGNGLLNVSIAGMIPPKKDPWLNGSDWNIDGEIPLTDRGAFTLTAIHRTQHKLAAFAGQCMRCMGEELVAGVWITGRTARDCRDTIVAYGEKPDVLHKEVLHLLRAQKRKELELRANQTSTPKPSTEDAKESTKSWWEN